MKLRSSLFIIIFCLSGSAAYAAKSTTSLASLEKNVHHVQAEVNRLAKGISKLEKDLGSKNGEYLTTIKARQKLEVGLANAENALEKDKYEAKERSRKLRLILQRLTLQELDRNQNAAAMAARKLLKKQVQSQLTSLQEVMSLASSKEDELSSFHKRIDDYILTERRLAQLVETMEEQKKEQADAYLAAVGKKSAVEERLSALRLTKRRKVSKSTGVSARFSSPIEEFLGVEYDKKGITYKFTGRKPVVASDDGQVAYAGRLSTYGNVVLIDHGDETRSVILGQFVPKMKKGQKVTRGDVLGYTENTSAQGKLYFEVRKGDKVLDTIALMDKTFLNKHRITKI